jgi:hypothetical protein
MSLMELGRRIHAHEITLEDALREMKEGSSSVLLNWGEDDGELWECSWILGGKRYTHLHPQPRTAVLGAVVACIAALVEPCENSRFRRAPVEGGGVVYTDDEPIVE